MPHVGLFSSTVLSTLWTLQLENSCPLTVGSFLYCFYDDPLWETMFLRMVEWRVLVPVGQNHFLKIHLYVASTLSIALEIC